MLVHKCHRRFIFLFILICIVSINSEATRTEREGINGQDVGVNIEWLTDSQLSELSETEGGRSARLTKLKQFYDALEDSPAKTEATKKIVEQCYDWLNEVASQDERNDLQNLHETDHKKCHEKLHEYLNKIEEEKRGNIEEKLPFCEHVWYGQAHKHEHPENISGSKNEENIEANTGKEGEKVEEENKEENKEEKKDEAEHKHENHHHARKRWAHRHRRDHDHFTHDDGEHEHHELEDYLRTHLSWLTDEQKAEMRALKEEGAGKESLRSKAMQYFEQSTGEQRTEALKQLVSGCRELLRRIFGAEAADELKQMKESGANFEELEAKIGKMTETLSDEAKKQKAQEFSQPCKRIFSLSMSSQASSSSSSRRRREEGQQPTNAERLENVLKTHLSWLSDEQKNELKKDVEEGKTREDVKEKVMKWFEDIGEETEKEKARELLKGGCRELIKELLGEEAALKLKTMRENGSSTNDLAAETDKLLGQLVDKKKLEKAAIYTSTCKKIFGLNKSSRKRRTNLKIEEYNEYDEFFMKENKINDDKEILEQIFKMFMWLSLEQRNELINDLKNGKKLDVEIFDKIIGWFNKLKYPQKIAESLKGVSSGCMDKTIGDHDNQDILGTLLTPFGIRAVNIMSGREKLQKQLTYQISNEHFYIIKKLKEDIIKEINENKIKAKYCNALLDNLQMKRIKRDHNTGHEGGHHNHEGGHKLEDYFKTHLSWLNETQKELLKTMKGEGKTRPDLQKKVMEWFEELQGETKTKALELMQTGCRELLKITLGEDKAIEVKNMKEAGTDFNTISNKIDEWINDLNDQSHMKKIIEEYKPICRKLFGVGEEEKKKEEEKIAGRKRRAWRDSRENDEEGSSWKNIYNDKLRNSRNRDEEEGDEVEVDPDESTYPRAQNIEKNEDQDESEDEHDLGNEHLNSHRTWLTPSQQRHLEKMRELGHESHEIHDKINEYHETSPEEVKKTAQGILKRGCESVLQRLFGEYIADEIIEAREQGASKAELDKKINTALGHITDKKKRREASRFAATCRRIFTMIERRRRSVSPPPIDEQSLDELFASHLSWLNLSQQDELRRIRDEGLGRTEMQKRVVEWLGELTGNDKAVAIEKMREGCTLLLLQVYGGDQTNELIKLKNSGASEHQIVLRLFELNNSLDEEQKREKFKAIGPICKQFFNEAS